MTTKGHVGAMWSSLPPSSPHQKMRARRHGTTYFLQISAATTLPNAMSKSVISCFKCWNPCPNRNWIPGFIACISTTVLYLQLERSKSLDKNLTETTKVLAIRNMLKLFHSPTSLVGSVGKVLGPHTDNLKRKGISRSIHFRYKCIQMLAKHSLEFQAHQILMFQASVTFFQLSLAVNLQRHRKPMPPFHLTNRSRSAAKGQQPGLCNSVLWMDGMHQVC